MKRGVRGRGNASAIFDVSGGNRGHEKSEANYPGVAILTRHNQLAEDIGEFTQGAGSNQLKLK